MAHHHKQNQQVEGDPDTGHSDGLPLRPDEERLQERTQVDRAQAGLPIEHDESDAEVRAEADEAAEATRAAEDDARDRGDDFPPTRYDG
ncbi:hypothetical protein [Actinomadura rupiterrae]|uniref:hypothetical protein n=1 Tax=Actinomadura rupiterrae TaxID=559627 RepID=UPI0020A58DCE|nr:hypothetical protein [Actinomadura rupiterrae]MCP2342094.1 hypothetical protein [Actinomadura rupiterrae]